MTKLNNTDKLINEVVSKYGEGEWVVEKGKVAETRLIKKLFLELKATEKCRINAEDHYNEYFSKVITLERIVTKKDEEISVLSERLMSLKDILLKSITEKLKYL